MIIYKSEEEIKLLRVAGKIVALTHEYLKPYIKPGISTKELDILAEKFILSQGATCSFKGYQGFPGAICASVNDVLVHGIPSEDVILKDGDVITLDIGACYKGYHGDSAWTYAVGEVSEEAKRLMEVSEKSLYIGLEQVKPGNRISDIGHAIQLYLESNGYGVPRDYTGHGVGKDIHEDPIIPNYGVANRGPKIAKGMVFAIEPMVTLGEYYTRTLFDDWTVKTIDGKITAHYEHTVAVTDDGYEILTKI
jgi:methionyl aminopeptidase